MDKKIFNSFEKEFKKAGIPMDIVGKCIALNAHPGIGFWMRYNREDKIMAIFQIDYCNIVYSPEGKVKTIRLTAKHSKYGLVWIVEREEWFWDELEDLKSLGESEKIPKFLVI